MSRGRSGDIEREAERWVARQDAAPLSDFESAQLKSWLAANARHLGAFVRAQAVWIASEGAGPSGRACKPSGPSAVRLSAGG